MVLTVIVGIATPDVETHSGHSFDGL